MRPEPPGATFAHRRLNGQVDVRNGSSGGIEFRDLLAPNEAISSVINDLWAWLAP
jgi:hypothetical protein